MKIKIVRDIYTDTSVTGQVYIDEEKFCYSLEDPPRVIKIAGRTGIPAGIYNVGFHFSDKFQKFYPIIEGVPGFSYIYFHSGNDAAATQGCVLLGLYRGADVIHHSRDAFDAFWEKILMALTAREQITVEIIDTQKPKLF